MSILETFAQETELHGFRRVRSTSFLPRRLIWGVLIIVAWLALIYVIVDRILYYKRYPYVTIEDSIPYEELNFPAVTICNPYQFKVSAYTAEDIRKYWNLHFTWGHYDFETVMNWHEEQWGKYFNNASYQHLRNIYERDGWKKQPTNFESNSTYAADARRLGYQLEDLIEQIDLGGSAGIGSRIVTNLSALFTQHLVFPRGNCYTMNGIEQIKKKMVITASSPQDWGEINIVITLKNTLVNNAYSTFVYPYFPRDGVDVSIHDALSLPVAIWHDFQNFAPGFYDIGIVENANRILLPKPWGRSECTTSASLDYYDSYSRSTCILECVAKNFSGNSAHPFYDLRGQDCILTDFVPVHQNLEEYYNAERKVIEAGCIKACPSRCATWHYPYKVKKYPDMIPNTVTLYLSLESLSVKMVEQVPSYWVTSLLAEVGGYMGLLTGGSILTILHLVQFVLNYPLSRCRCNEKVHLMESISN